jgi:hypothetical protein
MCIYNKNKIIIKLYLICIFHNIIKLLIFYKNVNYPTKKLKIRHWSGGLLRLNYKMYNMTFDGKRSVI